MRRQIYLFLKNFLVKYFIFIFHFFSMFFTLLKKKLYFIFNFFNLIITNLNKYFFKQFFSISLVIGKFLFNIIKLIIWYPFFFIKNLLNLIYNILYFFILLPRFIKFFLHLKIINITKNFTTFFFGLLPVYSIIYLTLMLVGFGLYYFYIVDPFLLYCYFNLRFKSYTVYVLFFLSPVLYFYTVSSRMAVHLQNSFNFIIYFCAGNWIYSSWIIRLFIDKVDYEEYWIYKVYDILMFIKQCWLYVYRIFF